MPHPRSWRHVSEWVVGDAAAFTGRFDTVLASALFHCLPPEQRPGLVAALRKAAVDGALLNPTSLAVEGIPFDVTESELRTALPVWVVGATATG